jgi:phospholipid-translocating ATPase
VIQARDQHTVSIRVHGEEEKWKLLNVLEFNSDRKRMSVIVEDPFDGMHVIVRSPCVDSMETLLTDPPSIAFHLSLQARSSSSVREPIR